MSLRSCRRGCGSTIVACAVALAGCGDGDEPAGPGASVPSSATTAGDHGSRAEAGASSHPAGAPAPWFEPAPGAGGIDFVHGSGFDGARPLMPEIMGGGAALADLDGDGDLDAYLVQSGDLRRPGTDAGANRLYLNRGDGTFAEATDGSGAGERGYGQGVTCADYDSDGDLDLYVTNVGANALLRNEGDGRFTDVTASSGTGHAGWGTSATFLDADGDGDLDLFVCNYLEWSVETELDCVNELGTADYCSPQNYGAPARDVLYVNQGDGTFLDASDPSGIATAPGTGLGVVAIDFDDDGDLDVFVANDGMRDRLWVNAGNGTFTDEALLAGCAVDRDGVEKAGMGVAVGDLDGDGDADLMVCNLNRQSDSLYLNTGGRFDDSTARAGLAAASRPFTRFGMAFADFDHDGRLDLYQANGRVMQQGTRLAEDPYAEPNLLFRGIGPARFEEVSPRGGTAMPIIATTRAAAFGDVDRDGDLDVLLVNRDAPATLLLNTASSRHADRRWIGFRCRDAGGVESLNAIVRVTAGERRQRRDAIRGYSYLAASDAAVHMGLGDAAAVTAVEVRWPDGLVEQFGGFEAGAVHELVRGTGSAD